MNKNDLLQQVRGSITNFEPLDENNLLKVAEEGLTMEEVRLAFERAGLNASKIIVDPSRMIYNVYYADYDKGLYFDVYLTREHLTDPRIGPAAVILERQHRTDFLKERDWDNFYFRDVPTPLRIYDFQKRVYDIEPEQVYKVWSFIHRNIDYANSQWKDDILDYVFDHAPKPDLPALNDNGLITIYRGAGKLSQPPGKAISWSSNKKNALWFANHSGLGQALYEAEVAPENVVAYYSGFQNENEVIIRRNSVLNIRKAVMIPVSQEKMNELLAPALSELLHFGKYVAQFGYERERVFDFHGQGHILRVLLLALIYYYKSDTLLTQRDKRILLYFSLLHDIGRSNDDADNRHGENSVTVIMQNKISIPRLELGKKDLDMAHLIIRYHCLPDKDGYAAIAAIKKYSSNDIERLKQLYQICKDIDGLDRVRLNDLDVDQLRTEYAKKLPLVAGALLQVNIEQFVNNTKNI